MPAYYAKPDGGRTWKGPRPPALFLPLDEPAGPTRADASGSGLVATLQGASADSGPFGPCLAFNGSSGYADLGSSDALKLGGANSSFTVACWCRADAPGTNGNLMAAIRRATGSSAWEYILGFVSSAGALIPRFQMWGPVSQIAAGPAVAAKTWVHLCGVRDGAAGLVRIYVNGVQVGTAANNPGDFSLSTNTVLGQGGIGFVDWFNGAIDAPFAAPYALSPAEVARLADDSWWAVRDRRSTDAIVGATSSTTLVGTGIASGEAFGAGVVSPGPVTVVGTGIASGEAFGAGSLSVGGVTITGSGIASGEAFGAGVVSSGGILILGTGIASAQAFGAGTVGVGPVTITGTGIASAESFGAGTVSSPSDLDQALVGVGIASAESFGAGTVTRAETAHRDADGYAAIRSLLEATGEFGDAVTIGRSLPQAGRVSSEAAVAHIRPMGSDSEPSAGLLRELKVVRYQLYLGVRAQADDEAYSACDRLEAVARNALLGPSGRSHGGWTLQEYSGLGQARYLDAPHPECWVTLAGQFGYVADLGVGYPTTE